MGLVGVADDDEVRRRGDGGGPQDVPVGGVGEHPLHRHPRGPQRRLRLGEPGVHDRGQPRSQRREQGEPLGAPREDEHLVGTATVPRGDGRAGGGVVRGGRVAGQVVQRGDEPLAQPTGWGRAPDVDREVEQPRRGVDVPVVAQRIHARHPKRNRARGLRLQWQHGRLPRSPRRCSPPSWSGPGWPRGCG